MDNESLSDEELCRAIQSDQPGAVVELERRKGRDVALIIYRMNSQAPSIIIETATEQALRLVVDDLRDNVNPQDINDDLLDTRVITAGRNMGILVWRRRRGTDRGT